MSILWKLAIVGIVIAAAVGLGAYGLFLWDNCWSKPLAEVPGWCLLVR